MTMPQMIKEYKNVGQFKQSATWWKFRGWEVESVTNINHKTGCLRLLLGGFLFRKGPTIVVTYKK